MRMARVDMEDLLLADMEVGALGLEILSVGAQPAVLSWSRLQEATREDQVLTKLVEEIQRGMPYSSNDMLKELWGYHS